MFIKQIKISLVLLVLITVFSYVNKTHSSEGDRGDTNLKDLCRTYMHDSKYKSNRSNIFFSKLMFHFSKTYEKTLFGMHYGLAGICTHEKAFIREKYLHETAISQSR